MNWNAGDLAEPLVDLNLLLDKCLCAADLAVLLLRSMPDSFITFRLLTDILVARKEIAQLQSSCRFPKRILIEPSDPDYLVLHAMEQRLDRIAQNATPDNMTIDHADLLVSTVEKGLAIARNLVCP